MKHIILAGMALAAIKNIATGFDALHTLRIPIFIQNSPLGPRCKYAVQSLRLLRHDGEPAILRQQLLSIQDLVSKALEALDAFENSERT